MQAYFGAHTGLVHRLVVRHPGSDSATVVRGLAAMTVFMTHTAGFGTLHLIASNSYIGSGLRRFVELGAWAPAAFFIASGFALASSYSRNPRTIARIAFARFFRLAPLYWVAVLCTLSLLVLIGSFNFSSLRLFDLATRLGFLDAFTGLTYKFDVTGVAWTIPIEFWWSLTVPFLILLWHRGRRGYVMVLFLLLLASLATPRLLPLLGLDPIFAAKSLPTAGVYFAIGVAIWGMQQARSHIANDQINQLCLLLIIFAIWGFLYYFSGAAFPLSVVGTLLVVGYMLWAQLPVRKEPIRTPGLLIWLGTICYGVYLWHPFVLLSIDTFTEFVGKSQIDPTVRALIALPIVLVLASLSWLYIERPMINLGRRLELRKPG